MVLTKQELIASLQNEVRILQHLISKMEPKMLDYRPTPKQRSMIELLRYLSFMGPTMLPGFKAGEFDVAAWTAAEKAAAGANLEQVSAALTKQPGQYADLLAGFTDADLRGEVEMFGQKASRGSLIVSLVLCGLAAYRTQLFLYLKSCGRDELNTYNLWAGVDGTMEAAS